MYHITHVWKTIERDSYDQGCIGDGTDHGDTGYRAKNADLRALVVSALEAHGLASDYVFVPDEDGTVARFTANRMENDNGDDPSLEENARFKAGEISLWLADYSFSVQWIESRDLRDAEFRSALTGITVEG